MIRQFITLYGHPYTVERERISEGFIIPSVVLFCPRCLEQWGKLTFEGDWFHLPVVCSCVACDWADYWHPVPGSIISNSHPSSGVDWALLEALPKHLLDRELNVTLRDYENRQAKILYRPSQGQVEHSGPDAGVSHSDM